MTHHTACQAAGHEGKPNKEKETCTPGGMRVAKTFFFADAILVDQIYDENAEEGTEPRDPIRDGGMHGYRVIRLVVRWERMYGENDGIQIPRPPAR